MNEIRFFLRTENEVIDVELDFISDLLCRYFKTDDIITTLDNEVEDE